MPQTSLKTKSNDFGEFMVLDVFKVNIRVSFVAKQWLIRCAMLGESFFRAAGRSAGIRESWHQFLRVCGSGSCCRELA